jgi:orotidine-5'-phosphate decarboxylase
MGDLSSSLKTWITLVKKVSIPIEKRIIVALDVASVEEAKAWVKRLEARVRFFKVGLELFLAGWFDIVDWILDRGSEVMVDLKFFDVPETVASAVKQLRGHGVTFATVHGNDKILRAAVENKGETKILAVTVLTSLDQADIDSLGFRCDVPELVFSRAERALHIGCDGVVSSGLEAPRLRKGLGERLLIVVPGVRPVYNDTETGGGSWSDDQKRTITIHEAFRNGADHVVVGRPIRNASDPLELLRKMQEEIQEALPV